MKKQYNEYIAEKTIFFYKNEVIDFMSTYTVKEIIKQ